MLAFLVRRLFFAAVALVAVVVIDYAMFGNLWHQLDRAFLHFDFGDASRARSRPSGRPWRFVEAMVVPWIVLAAPFAAVVMRLALWAAVLIVVVSALADVALVMLDPRVRATARPVG